ncbi:hypothetical protein NL676_007440 [Syzygium grande]|nr:hypothetical protein NL676_007440 [Syzygium grande]
MSHEMTRRYMMDMITYTDTDVVVVGASSAGLSCAYELSKNPLIRVAIIEQSISPGRRVARQSIVLGHGHAETGS